MMALLAGIVCLAFAVETLLGFGGTLIALSIGAAWWPVDELVSLLIPVNLLLSAYLCVRLHQSFDLQLFLVRVLPFILLGLVLGLVAGPWLGAPTRLEALLGSVLVMVAGLELAKPRTPADAGRAVVAGSGGRWGRRAALLAFCVGGVVHSLLTVGGPFIVLGLQPLRLMPEVQRVTLAALWLLLNTALLGWRWQTDLLTPQHLEHSLWLLPGVGGGILVGEWLASHIRGEGFQRLVWLMLLGAGANLILKAWS